MDATKKIRVQIECGKRVWKTHKFEVMSHDWLRGLHRIFFSGWKLLSKLLKATNISHAF